MKTIWVPVLLVAMICSLVGCQRPEGETDDSAAGADAESASGMVEAAPEKYRSFKLESDLTGFSDGQRKMVGLMIEAAQIMDELFWFQAYGDKQQLLRSISDLTVRRYAVINYGPWDRLAGNAPFMSDFGPKPKGANFYPQDMTPEEFEKAAAVSEDAADRLKSLYTMVRRDADGGLKAVSYSVMFRDQLSAAAAKLREAAVLAEDPGFRRYLELRADALLTDDYRPSDMAWMEMKENSFDLVIGPIENYEDQMFNYKTAFSAYVLIKDKSWSERLSKYAAMLPELQRGLPVPDAYKAESPGSDSDLNAYDVVYYAGDCNAGSKTIAINLPNDEIVQKEKGSRRLQLKNAMRAKFDEILLPISEVLIAEDQRQHVTFDAFFANTMFHEVAHGLGIKNTLDGSDTVRRALKDQSSALEEGKADILGLYMVTKLHEQGEIGDAPLEDYYVTFLAGIFRSVRFGASSAHGRANMLRFNFFKEMGAFTREGDVYRANFKKMGRAIDALSEKILRLQGDGDYDGVQKLMREQGIVGAELQRDLDRLSTAGIPVDVVFEQGTEVLGL